MSDTNDTDIEISARNNAIADLIESEPNFIEGVKDYYAAKRADYVQRIGDMEHFLGFIEVEGDLGTRIGKLENFLKIPSK